MRQGLGLGIKRRPRGFLPVDLIPAVWFDAGQGIVLNDTDVAQWDDLSGNDRDAAQGTAANQPAYDASGVNGRPSVNFDPAATEYLEIADDATVQNLFSGGGSIFVAGAIGSANAFSRLLVKRQSAGWIFGTDTNGTALRLFYDFDTNDGQWISDTAFPADGSPLVLEVHYDSDDVANDPEFVINGVSSAVTEATTPSGSAASDAGVMWIGGDTGGNTSDLHAVGIPAYGRILTEPERVQVRRYLGALLGLSL